MLAIVGIFLTWRQHHGTPVSQGESAPSAPVSSRGGHSSTAPSPPTTHTATSPPRGTPATSSVATPPSTAQPESPRVSSTDKRFTQAIRIARAYYLLRPGDTEATRRARLAKLLPPAALSQLDISLTQTASEARKLSTGESRRALVAHAPLAGTPVAGIFQVVVLVRPSLYQGGKLISSEPQVTTTCIWSKDNEGQWIMAGFSVGGNS